MSGEREGGGGPLLVTTIRLRRELDDGVQGDLDVGQVGVLEVVEVCVSAIGRSAIAKTLVGL